MRSHARLMGHSVHQMLIVFPLGLLATAVVFDIVAVFANLPELSAAAYWMIIAGVIGGLTAAPFGLIDWLHIERGTRARRIGAMHGIGNVVVVVLFSAAWLLRERGAPPPTISWILAVAAILLSLVTAWIGGELVSRLGIGVYDDANPNAPSSLDEDRSTERSERSTAPRM
jgi:uncharacterized membrane protein